MTTYIEKASIIGDMNGLETFMDTTEKKTNEVKIFVDITTNAGCAHAVFKAISDTLMEHGYKSETGDSLIDHTTVMTGSDVAAKEHAESFMHAVRG